MLTEESMQEINDILIEACLIDKCKFIGQKLIFGVPVDGEILIQIIAIALKDGKTKVQTSWDNSSYYRKGLKLQIDFSPGNILDKDK